MLHNALWQRLEITKEKVSNRQTFTQSHTHTHTHTRLWWHRGRETFTTCTGGHTMPNRPFSLSRFIQSLSFSFISTFFTHFQINHFLDAFFVTMRISVIHHWVGNIGEIWGIGLQLLASLGSAVHTNTNTHTNIPSHHNSVDSHSAGTAWDWTNSVASFPIPSAWTMKGW